MEHDNTDNQPKGISWLTRAKMALAGAVLAGAAFGAVGMAAPEAEPAADEEAFSLNVEAKVGVGGGGTTHGFWATWS